jgi:Icc-related predicted phosphoesterase
MRINHFSDNHGVISRLKGGHNNFEVALSTGDLLPDPPSMGRNLLAGWQAEWVSSHLEDFRNFLQGRTLLFVLGNHDWLPADQLEAILTKAGISAISLHDKIVSYEGVNFYGFPYIPYFRGQCNYECRASEMIPHIDRMVQKVNESFINVIAAHCPPFGCLDLAFQQNLRIGNTAMANALDYKIDREKMPDYYCCGHIHSPALTMRDGMLVSNAATTHRILEI